jgi:hypothetical protein
VRVQPQIEAPPELLAARSAGASPVQTISTGAQLRVLG